MLPTYVRLYRESLTGLLVAVDGSVCLACAALLPVRMRGTNADEAPEPSAGDGRSRSREPSASDDVVA